MSKRFDKLPLTTREELLPEAEIEAWGRPQGIRVVAATVGEDEHSVGLHEILDIKHGGIEKYGFQCHDLGTSISVDRVLDEAQATGARAVLVVAVRHLDGHAAGQDGGHVRLVVALAVGRLLAALLLGRGGLPHHRANG